MLYGLDVGGAELILLKIEHLWDQLEENGQKPNEFVKNGKMRLEEARCELRTEDGKPLIDFQHPYSWAAFNIVGNAHFGMSPHSEVESSPGDGASDIVEKKIDATIHSMGTESDPLLPL